LKSKDVTSTRRKNSTPKIILPNPQRVVMGSGFGAVPLGTGNSFQGQLDGSRDMSTFSPEIRNPTLSSDQFFMPQFISVDGSPNRELNSWFRHYARWHPLVKNLIQLHSSLPISRFGLVGVTDKKILQFFEDNSDELDILTVIMDALKEYFTVGEVQPFAKWDKNQGKFTDLKLLDTDYINVTSHYMLNSKDGEIPELYEYIPDEYLKALVRTDNPFEQELLEDNLDDELRYAIENNFTLILDPFCTTMIRDKHTPRDLRGTSMLNSILKILMLDDKLREQAYASAQQNINPIRLWKIGNENFLPDDAMLEGMKNLILQAQYDPQLNLVTHPFVELDIQGATGKVDKMKDDYEYIEKQILTGLWSSKAFVHSDGITLNSSTVAMRMLMGRYLPIRAMFENYFYRKIFLPTALEQDFYKPLTQAQSQHGIRPSNKDRELVYPLFDWRHKQSLMDDQSVRSMLISLRDKSQMPMKVICDSLDLDYNYVKTWLEKETNTVFDNDMIESKKTLMNSAVAGGLKDSGKGMVQRIIDAGANWAQMIFGSSPNLQSKETDEAKKIREESDTSGDSGMEAPPAEGLDSEQLKENKRFFSTEEGKAQLRVYDTINKKADKVKKELERFNKVKAPFNPNIPSQDDIMVKLRNLNYDGNIVSQLKGQLLDLKLALASEGVIYSEGSGSLGASINKVLSGLKDGYTKKLYNLGKYSAQTALNILNVQANLGDYIPENFTAYALKNSIKEVDVEDAPVRRAVWNQVYPILEKQIVSNFLTLSKKVELDTFEKLGVLNVYLNNEKTAIKDITASKLADISTTIVPDTGSKIRHSINIRKCAVKNCPVESVPQVIKTVEKLNATGVFDLSGVNFTNSKYNDTIVDSHLTAKFYNIANIEMEEMFSKHMDLEDSELDWFLKRAKNVIYGIEENKEVEEFIKKYI
jgi:predicted transcriptional regulator YheO